MLHCRTTQACLENNDMTTCACRQCLLTLSAHHCSLLAKRKHTCPPNHAWPPSPEVIVHWEGPKVQHASTYPSEDEVQPAKSSNGNSTPLRHHHDIWMHEARTFKAVCLCFVWLSICTAGAQNVLQVDSTSTLRHAAGGMLSRQRHSICQVEAAQWHCKMMAVTELLVPAVVRGRLSNCIISYLSRRAFSDARWS